ncbi:MAG TPA: hypothetical protein VHM91_08105 [Verrucomicrobiales bacterium]|jgi:hypothetical protein|nr:hypothetical protein [Verrucomicrobiales bacterium]
MKTILAAPAGYHDYAAVCEAVLKAGFPITEVLTVMAPPENTLSRRWARENGVPLKELAGSPVDHAQALIAVWDGECENTGDVIREARSKELEVYVHLVAK